MTSVVWTTPLGLPVVQPYRRLDTMEIVTPLQRITVFNPNKPAFIVKSRQINGIAPNYIHSLDSTHLLMTAEEMHKQNMTFASVHDSFGHMLPTSIPFHECYVANLWSSISPT